MVQIAVITGGSRGLGRASVIALAKKGINSVFTYNSDSKSADEVVKAVKEAGADAASLQLDVSKPETIPDFVAQLKQIIQSKWNTDKIDFLVNNAGVGSNSTLEDVTGDELDKLYNIHYKSVVLLCQALVPIINQGGRILNTSTGLTRWTMPSVIAYASIKGAVEVFTKYLAAELGSRRIAVNCLSPGAIATDFGGSVLKNEAVAKSIGEGIALGRIGQPEDIGDAVAALLSSDMRWLNGEVVEISGGQKL